MTHRPIISRSEALQILANQLRKAALKRREVELRDSTPAEREKIMEQVEREIAAELRRRAKEPESDTILH